MHIFKQFKKFKKNRKDGDAVDIRKAYDIQGVYIIVCILHIDKYDYVCMYIQGKSVLMMESVFGIHKSIFVRKYHDYYLRT